MVHRYEIPLRSGEFCHLEVAQNHLDATVRIVSAQGVVLAEVDNAIDREEPLSLSILAARGGIHRVEIRLRSRRTASGQYRIVIKPAHEPTADDQKRLAAERLRSEADRMLTRGDAGTSKEALGHCERALAAWREIGDRREEAATLGRMSDALGGLGELRPALLRADEALAIWSELEDRRGEAAALDRVGLAHSELGDQIQALAYIDQALALRRADGNVRGPAESLNDIAVARGAFGEIPEAIARYTDALGFARASGDRLVEAMVLKNRAVDYLKLGEMDRALVDLRDALARFRVLGDRHLQGIAEYHIGDISLDRKDVRGAVGHYQAALALLRETGDGLEGLTLNHLGLAELAARRPQRALRCFQQSWELLHACEDRRGEAMVSANIGRALLDQGDTVAARDRLLQSSPWCRPLPIGCTRRPLSYTWRVPNARSETWRPHGSDSRRPYA